MVAPHTAEILKEHGMTLQSMPNTLWQMSKDGHAAACAMAPSPVGVEAQFLIDGRMLASYQFGTHAQVMAWAIEKCTDLTARGWTVQAGRSQQYLAA